MTIKHQRGAQAAIIYKINKFVSQYDETQLSPAENEIALTARLNLLREARTEYLHLQSTITDNETNPEEKGKEIKREEEMLEKCSDIEIAIAEILTSTRKNTPEQSPSRILETISEAMHRQTEVLQYMAERNNSETKNTHPPPHHLNLPKLELPTFSGKYSEWMHFKGLFTTTIHNHPSLSNIEKLSYLKTSLRGAAATEIMHIDVSEYNYMVAWQLIQNRYDDKTAILNEHITTFLHQPNISKPTSENIRQLLSTSNGAVHALDALKATGRDPWLLHIILEKLDEESRILWARESHNETLPSWASFVEFLNIRCRTLERGLSTNKSHTTSATQSRQTSRNSQQTASFISTRPSQECVNCKNGYHPLYRCQKFLGMSSIDRFEYIKRMHLCRNCITEKHMTNSCSYPPCRKCNVKHNALLHQYFVSNENPNAITTTNISGPIVNCTVATPTDSMTAQPENSSQSQMSEDDRLNDVDDQRANSATNSISSMSCLSTSYPKVLLATVVVRILDSNNTWRDCRAVLDCASQANLITTNFCQSFGLLKRSVDIDLVGVGNNSNSVKQFANVSMSSRVNENEQYNMDCLVVKKITGDLPNWPIHPENIQLPPNIELADPLWYKQQPIELLIGGQFYWDIVQGNSIQIQPNLPKLQNTTLGWVLVGELKESTSLPQTLHCNIGTYAQLDGQLRKFWELEDVSDDKIENIEHQEVEQHFLRTFGRDDDGRFVVALPFRENVNELGDSRSRAIRNLNRLEKRLDRNPVLRKQYNDQLNEYLTKGFMEPTTFDPDSPNYYLPHHGVVRENSSTTKLRVVFNASAPTSTGKSLNSVLKSAQTVQPELLTVLLRFRLHRYAMSCDITKMYLQLKLYSPHAEYQRIVWRKSPDEPIQDYKITRVCFGVKSSPFMATRALNQLAYDERNDLPLASRAVLSNFYVDDGLISCDTLDEAEDTQQQLLTIMERGGFTLAKWNFNHRSLYQNMEEYNNQYDSMDLPNNSVGVLGFKWNPSSDIFQYNIGTDYVSHACTKLEVISIISGIYDPAGWIGCVVIEAKLIMQETWKSKLDWNDKLPMSLQLRFDTFMTKLPHLNELKLPRWASTIQSPDSIELHGFSDASTHAYGCTIYLITRSTEGFISSHLLIAKSRVAPISPSTTIPRLELCGAALCARLMSRLQSELNISSLYFWCDSEIVLHWIHSTEEKGNVFVFNRIRAIKKASNLKQWRHVSSADNPADLISRGCSPETLLKSSLWFHGPSWLQTDKSNWPPPFQHSVSLVTSLTSTNPVTSSREIELDASFSENYSSLLKLQRMAAFALRFISNCRKTKETRKLGPIDASDLKQALLKLISIDQRIHFASAIKALSSGQTCNQLKSMANIKPFLDDMKMMRVMGRLSNSSETYDTKHPLILPHSHLTTIIARHTHFANQHAGAQLLLSTLRQQFWPIDGRNLTRNIIRNCVKCFRVQPRFKPQLMGDLPKPRVTHLRCFEACAIDFAGPVNIRFSSKRGGALTKAYICVFVCMSIKACHLEVCSNLSSDAFLACLRRFVARRSCPDHIYSDNGLNFVGCNNELRNLLQSQEFQNTVQNEASSRGITWHFQPPRSPHHGGLFEACVKSLKFHLRRVVGQAPLTFEELQTVITQIEATLNSRPLTPLSEDVSDPPHLTPGHFLVGRALNALPDPDLTAIPLGRLDRWRLCQRMVQEFSKRWKLEYLTTLQKRNKWTDPIPNFEIGNIVLLQEDNLPSVVWPLGIIVNVFPGKDKVVRVVEVRTSKGTYRRTVNKVAKIPVDYSAPEDVNAHLALVAIQK